MGKVWTRDGQHQSSTAQRRPTSSHAHSVKRPRVWRRETQASQANSDTPGASVDADRLNGTTQPAQLPEESDAKRRRLAAKGRLLPDAWISGATNSTTAHGLDSPPITRRQPMENGAQSAADSDTRQALRLEALALRRQIAEEEAKLAASKAAASLKEAQQAAAERARRDEQQLRKSRLDAGFAEAFKLTRELAASQQAPKVSAADDVEVRRVLAAGSDLEVLQLKPGADKATVKRKYKAMTLALHPDKCKAANATDAFQRLVHAYQGALKYAR